MVRRFIIVLVLSVAVSGCATFRRSPSAVSQLQLRVGELERVVQTKDQRIAELEYELKDLAYDVKQLKEKSSSSRTISYTRSSSSKMPAKTDGKIIRLDVDHKVVQQALKSAGYYDGNIDGNVGSGTKKAIVQFQKDNGLKADGLVGQQTWEALQSFME